ncbi:outer membrane beta-barrel protein [Cyclobacterium sp. SYSU L10401]|uniref:outer membrane beta-barrel protein n=1 Tax=Cyclobacterium sp. SYSU L10401 TaxID=2678657 RepID=UPI0013D0492B|nr:outer membrane beta-barrel protein [Cyclobacterium sp. SYSU L10401]
MKQYRSLISIIFLINFGFSSLIEANCQGRIDGKVQDVSGSPVPYANVLLLSATDSSVIKGTVTEESGSFYFNDLNKAQYLLSVTLIGYTKYWDHIMVQANTEIDLPIIRLTESENELDEVQVTAQLPLYEKKIDRMVINVQSSITSAGNSVLEVLQKSPGVMVNSQSNAIQLNGKGGVTIMINNRIQRLPSEVVFQMLDGMSAANIKKIELITTPPAKYDAEGMGGIIHLILAESEDLGTNGSFGLTGGMNARETLGVNFNLNYRKNKFSFFIDYSLLYDHNVQNSRNRFQISNPGFVSSFHSIMDRPYKLTTQNVRTGLEWELNSNTRIGSILSGFQRHHHMFASSIFNNKITADSSRYGTIKIEELNLWNHFTSNIHLIHKINQHSSLRLDLDYNWSKNNNPSDYLINSNYPERQLSTSEIIDVTKETPIHMKVAGLDYTLHPSDAFKFEAGFKGTFSNFKNNVEVLFTQNERTSRNEELSILAYLEENVLAGYVSAEWTINEFSQIIGGLRFENTQTYISTATEKGVVDWDFGNFFPSIFYRRVIDNKFSLNFSYSRRIERPNFNDLAPFVFFVDPNSFFSGNPALLPAKINGVKTDINFKRASMSLEYSHIKDPIAPFQPEFDSLNSRQVFRSQNLDYQKIYSINLSLPWIITDWWDIQLNTGSFYTQLRTAHLEENKNSNFFNFTANVTHNFKLPHDFSVEITGLYQSKMNWGIWQFDPISNLNVGFQKKLNNNRGTLRLTFDDIFYNNVLDLTSFIPEYNMSSLFVLDRHVQAVRLNYTRNFGNKKLRGVKIKSGSEELQKRVQTN